MDREHKRTGQKICTTYSCPFCEHTYKDSYTLSDIKKKKPSDQEKKEFLHNKKRFCMSEREGEDFRKSQEGMKQLTSILKKSEADKEIKSKLAGIKKLPFVEVKKKLNRKCKKASFSPFNFKEPEIGRFIFVEFTVTDEKQGRDEYLSCKDLKKFIKDTLKDINWRLASDGIQYRMGFLTSRLRLYEGEDELMKLIKKKT